MCRSRRELSNEYLPAKFRFDTAENEPCQVLQIVPAPASQPRTQPPFESTFGLYTAPGLSRQRNMFCCCLPRNTCRRVEPIPGLYIACICRSEFAKFANHVVAKFWRARSRRRRVWGVIFLVARRGTSTFEIEEVTTCKC